MEMGAFVWIFSLIFAATLLSPSTLALTQDGKAPPSSSSSIFFF
jgi:hypothetical protein